MRLLCKECIMSIKCLGDVEIGDIIGHGKPSVAVSCWDGTGVYVTEHNGMPGRIHGNAEETVPYHGQQGEGEQVRIKGRKKESNDE